jgi:hypothetical protein
VRGVLALVVAAGCYDPAISVGLPCGDGCPVGQECQDGLCVPEGTVRADGRPGEPDAERIDARPIDTDMDGVFDDDDNCPADANTDQHDEDGDGRGDVCDLCPHVPEVQVQDADGDRVGDLCDPNTGVQNRIAFFDPFTSDRPEWTLVGAWVRANDKLSIDAGQDHAILDVPIGHSVLELAGRVVGVATLNNQLSLTVSNDGTTAVYCEIFSNGTPRVNLTENVDMTYTALDSALLPDPLPPSAFRFAAAQDAASDSGACTLLYAGNTYPLTGTDTIVPTAQTHINVQNLNIELDYAIQIDELPAP